jgi:hypothetical protein
MRGPQGIQGIPGPQGLPGIANSSGFRGIWSPAETYNSGDLVFTVQNSPASYLMCGYVARVANSGVWPGTHSAITKPSDQWMPFDVRCSGVSEALLPSQGTIGSEYAYVRTSNSIFQFSISADGSLVPLNPAAVATGNQSSNQSTIVDPIRHTLYSLNYSDNDISIFKINTDGTLTEIDRPLTIANPAHLIIDSTYSSIWISGISEIVNYPINVDGTLGLPNIQSFPGGVPNMTLLAEDQQQRYMLGYVWGGGLQMMTIAPDSRLQTSAQVRFAWHVDFDQGARYVFADQYGQLTTYAVGSSGDLTNVSSIGFAGDVGWIFNQAKNLIFAFESGTSTGIFEHTLSIGADGSLTQIQPTQKITSSALSNYGQASRFSLDPSGNYLYVIPPSGVGLQYSIDSTGALTPLSIPTFGSGLIGVGVSDIATVRF